MSIVNWHSGFLEDVLAASVIFAVYYRTVSTAIAGGDSGELVAEGCQLGTAHPPGYPLYTILVHLVSKLPGNTVAWRINIMSSVFTTLGAVLAGRTVQVVTQMRSGCYLTMGMLAFSPLIWQYAITAEVFAMNNLFVCLILLLVAQIGRSKKDWFVYFGAFICGLALCNQHTAVLFEAPLILGLAFLTGLVPYAYLPIAATLRPRAGSWGDLASFSGFLHHLLRKDYGTFRLYSGGGESESLQERLWIYFTDFSTRQGFYFAPILVVVGIYAAMRSSNSTCNNDSAAEKKQPVKRSKSSQRNISVTDPSTTSFQANVGIAFCLAEVTYLVAFHSLSNLPLKEPLLYGVHARFWMQPNILLFIWAGIGWDYLLSFTEVIQRSRVVGLILVGLLVAAQVHNHYGLVDQHSSQHFENYAKAILEPLPRNATLLVNYDMQWTSLRYYHICEGVRPDITLINLSMMTYKWWKVQRDRYPNLIFPGTHYTKENSADLLTGAFTLLDFIRANQQRKMLIFLGGKLTFQDPGLAAEYDTIPYGLSSEFVRKQQAPAVDKWAPKALRIWKTVRQLLEPLPDQTKYNMETWEWTIGRDWLDHVVETSGHALQSAIDAPQNHPKFLAYACYFLESAVALEGNASAAALFKNLGLAHIHLVRSSLPDTKPLPTPPDVLGTLQSKRIPWPEPTERWKTWCSLRFVEAWGRFLAHHDARSDPQFETMQTMYNTVLKSSGTVTDTANA